MIKVECGLDYDYLLALTRILKVLKLKEAPVVIKALYDEFEHEYGVCYGCDHRRMDCRCNDFLYERENYDDEDMYAKSDDVVHDTKGENPSKGSILPVQAKSD
jgi:hypothetical protein